MYVIRLPGGNLLVPASVLACGRQAHGGSGSVIGQAYVEIGPEDPDYQRLLAQSISEEEMAEIRRRWREDDEALRAEFEEFKARQPEE
jgi:hypothetical protein